MSATGDRKKVFVGLSGGVDSSVAALRLINEGHDVTGVFIKVWQPDFLSCNWEEERLDAMRAAAHLGIPFLTCDAAEAYRKEVGEYFIQEYKAGRTPNPDVMCNKYVKFGAFLEFARSHGADFVATGHYAERVVQEDGTYALRRGADTNKDQSYFLWTLTQEQLAHVLFPVGDSDKGMIRKEAAEAGLPTAAKKDSQGVCFLGQVDIKEFLSHFTTLEEGKVLDQEGKVIGVHDGAILYTLGQRHGFRTDIPETVYVTERNIEQNTITVGPEALSLKPQTQVRLESVHWIGDEPKNDVEIEVQFRYRQEPISVTLQKESDEWEVVLKSEADMPASGQSCVFYDGAMCLGGGIVR